MKQAIHNHQFVLEQSWATRFQDLEEALLRFKPHIVHFSGHGEAEGLVFEDDEGESEIINQEIFSNLFEGLEIQVECVLLNASSSEIQASALVKHVQYAIGMPSMVGDTAHIAFASSFYIKLAFGNSYQQAYNRGCTAMRRKNVPKDKLPVLYPH